MPLCFNKRQVEFIALANSFIKFLDCKFIGIGCLEEYIYYKLFIIIYKIKLLLVMNLFNIYV